MDFKLRKNQREEKIRAISDKRIAAEIMKIQIESFLISLGLFFIRSRFLSF
jgi:hypothetical protein